MRYPNKNIGRWGDNSAPLDEPEDILCTHAGYVRPTDTPGYSIYQTCRNPASAQDSNGDPVCSEHEGSQ